MIFKTCCVENKERIEKAEEEERKRKEEEEKWMREESEKVNVQEIAPEETLHSNAEALHAELSASADKVSPFFLYFFCTVDLPAT